MTQSESPLSRWMLRLEEAQPLDAASHLVHPLVHKVTDNDTLRAALQGHWLGHSAHPMVVIAPLGFWMSAALLHASGGPTALRPAQLLTCAGIVSAMPAAVTGLAEVTNTDQRGMRVAVVHAAVNVTALGMQTASWLAGRRGNRAASRLWSLAGVSVAGAGGYLGGHLSIARKVGSRDEAFTGTDSAS